MAEDMSNVSDGYHTFGELYDHRCHLFVALIRSNRSLSWRSKLHADGTGYPSWFIAGMKLPSGDITYHLPLWMWGMLEGISTHDRAPEWDGHTAADVVKRLRSWNESSSEAMEPLSISELEATARVIDAQSYELRLWSNGTYLVRAPSGEATEVPEEAVAGALARLFKTFF